ncbi:MAG: hypothetical protein IJ237_08785 [Oscillospiraceae bacterium]|nr:hypothetical protein [Oscillospiraceae bacterium]
MRRLIRADIRRILKKRSVILLFLIALGYLCFQVIGSFLAYEQDPFVAVQNMMSKIAMPEIILGLVILFGVYADDFRSMSYSCVIGRGLTRSKLVLAKLLDTVILSVFMYGIITLILSLSLKLMGCTFTPRLSRAFYMTVLVTVYKTVGYIALSSMILYITNNIPLSTIFLLLLYIAVPFSTLLFSLNPQVKAFHVERIHYAGIADNAFSDLLFGSVGMAIGKLLLGLVVYLGLVLFVTIKIFDKKELEF